MQRTAGRRRSRPRSSGAGPGRHRRRAPRCGPAPRATRGSSKCRRRRAPAGSGRAVAGAAARRLTALLLSRPPGHGRGLGLCLYLSLCPCPRCVLCRDAWIQIDTAADSVGVCDTQDALAASGLHECGQKHCGKQPLQPTGFSGHRARASKKQIQGRFVSPATAETGEKTGVRSIST